MTNSVVSLQTPSSSSNNAYLEAALIYADKGFKVLPLIPGEKRPAIEHGCNAATDNPVQIRAWWTSMPDANIGIATGKKSGFWALDLDEKNGVSGSASIRESGVLGNEPPQTLSAVTGTGGTHTLYAYPVDKEIKNRARLLPGVDVRGDGGYIVAAPSVVSGKPYRWANFDVPLAHAPRSLIELVIGPKSERSLNGPSDLAIVPEGGRNERLMHFAMHQLRRGYPHAEVVTTTHAANEGMCTPPLPTEEVTTLINNVIRSFQAKMTWHCSDMGNAGKMAEQYSDTLRYVTEIDQWLIWNDTYWHTVSERHVEGLAKETVRALHCEADNLPSGPMKEGLKKHALRSESAKSIVDMIKLLKSEPKIAISFKELDKNLHLFPVQNGVIDLETGQFSPPDRELYITQIAGVTYDPTAKCPEWEAFVLKVMGGDLEMATFMRDTAGYSLTSATSEQCIFLMFGFGANGKSTYLNTLRKLFGDLGAQVSANTLLDVGSKSGSAPSSDLVRLIGKRFVAISEVEDGKFLAEGLIKSLTGGEAIVARALYKAPVEFTPRAKFWVATNHKPTIRGTDDGIWRRQKFVPFTVKVEKKDQDPMLEYRLHKELPGIFNWAIEGCLAWYKNGKRLHTPPRVLLATEQYRSEMDIVGNWISEFCVEEPFLELNFDLAFRLFEPWCEENYKWSWSKKKLGQRFLERGYERLNTGKRVYRGLGIRKDIPPAIIEAYLNNSKFSKVFGVDNKTTTSTDVIASFLKHSEKKNEAGNDGPEDKE